MRMLRISHGFPKETVVRRICKFMAEKYAREQKPIKEWEGNNIFLGKIEKKTYIKKKP